MRLVISHCALYIVDIEGSFFYFLNGCIFAGDILVMSKPHSLVLFTSFALGVGFFGVQGMFHGSIATVPDLDSESLPVWQRPEGSLRVGLQVGHLKNNEAPEELFGLRDNG